ncbi:Protein of unknown function [Pyronema omphalodes CBS 100304]|uniref:Uncharacterized protein n=1 Tax=Pyronema omphalodes (strain CBS 100304) TaxID=1076935 RepID=U4LR95_PYROM|nr:Protein of unknown function [Pyronema omphalodes CBS 100304]
MSTQGYKERDSTYSSDSDTEVNNSHISNDKHHETSPKKQKTSHGNTSNEMGNNMVKLWGSTKIDIPKAIQATVTAPGGPSLVSLSVPDNNTNIQVQVDTDDDTLTPGPDEITGKDCRRDRKGKGKCLDHNNSPDDSTDEQLDRNTPSTIGNSSGPESPNDTISQPLNSPDTYPWSDPSNNTSWDLGIIPRFTPAPMPGWVICTRNSCPVALVPTLRWEQHMAQVHQMVLCSGKHGSEDFRVVDRQGYSFIADAVSRKSVPSSLKLDCGCYVQRPGGCLVAKDPGGRKVLFGHKGTCDPASWRQGLEYEAYSDGEDEGYSRRECKR